MARRQPRPRFGWNPNAGRYVDLDTGRFLSRQRVEDIVEGRIEAGFERANNLLYAALEGTGRLEDWHAAMEQELKQAHLQIAALGKGGWNQMDQADYGRVGGKLGAEYGYLNDFAKAIKEGRLTLGDIENRMQQYESGIWSSYWKSQDVAMARTGATHEDRVLDPAAKHCDDCINYAGEGIVEIGTLPAPGERSECGHRCRCGKRYYRRVRGRFRRVA